MPSPRFTEESSMLGVVSDPCMTLADLGQLELGVFGGEHGNAFHLGVGVTWVLVVDARTVPAPRARRVRCAVACDTVVRGSAGSVGVPTSGGAGNGDQPRVRESTSAAPMNG